MFNTCYKKPPSVFASPVQLLRKNTFKENSKEQKKSLIKYVVKQSTKNIITQMPYNLKNLTRRENRICCY